MQSPVPAEFYDSAYFTAGTKSNYKPYGPGDWADALVRMVLTLKPRSVLDVGCATGWVVKKLDGRTRASGFDISQWAIDHTVARPGRVWRGTVEDPGSWAECDLVLCTEVAEHLTDEQADALMQHAYGAGDRMLLLIATHHADGDSDASHINFHPIEWWEDLARERGWRIDDASLFNDDPHSVKMGWSGRFLLLGK